MPATETVALLVNRYYNPVHARFTPSRLDGFNQGGQLSNMTAERIRGLLSANPFRPFVLRLPSGKTVDVPHRDFAAISPTGRILVVLGEEDSETIVDVALVERAEVPAGK